jgi:transcriptional regulator with XRE-family HTH domain
VDPRVTEYLRERIEEIKRERGPRVTYNSLADEIGISSNQISKVRNGLGGIGARTLPRFAKFFGTSEKELIAEAKRRQQAQSAGTLADVRRALIARYPRGAVEKAIREYIERLAVDVPATVLEIADVLRANSGHESDRAIDDKAGHAKKLSEPPKSVPRNGAGK